MSAAITGGGYTPNPENISQAYITSGSTNYSVPAGFYARVTINAHIGFQATTNGVQDIFLATSPITQQYEIFMQSGEVLLIQANPDTQVSNLTSASVTPIFVLSTGEINCDAGGLGLFSLEQTGYFSGTHPGGGATRNVTLAAQTRISYRAEEYSA